NRNADADPAVPETLPPPFLEIVRGCLRRNPQQRWTIARIAAALHPAAPQQTQRVAVAAPLPQKPQPVRRKGRPWVWRSAFPIVVMLLGLAVLFAGFGALRQSPVAQPDAAAPRSESNPQSQEPRAAKPSPKTKSRPGQPSDSSALSLPPAP